MSTIPSTNSSSNATTTTSQSSNNALSSNPALQQAAQSIISGSTGNTGLEGGKYYAFLPAKNGCKAATSRTVPSDRPAQQD